MRRKSLLALIGGCASSRGYLNVGAEFLPVFSSQLAKVKAGTDRLRLLMNGDSTMRGVGSGTGVDLNLDADLTALPKRLSELIDSRGIPSLHNSWVGGGFSSGGRDSRITLGSGWNFGSNNSLGGPMMRCANTSTDTTTFDFLNPFTNGRIYYLRVGGNGQYEYDIDGGAATFVDSNGATAIQTSSFSIERDIHSINLRRTSGGKLDFILVETWDETRPAIDVFNAGQSSADALGLASSVNPVFSPLPMIGTFAAHTLIFQTGINDAQGGVIEGDFKLAVQSVIDRQRNVVRGDVVLLSSTPAVVAGGEAARRAYARYLRDLAISNRVTFIDITELMGTDEFAQAMSWKGNGLHINGTGYVIEAELILRALPGI